MINTPTLPMQQAAVLQAPMPANEFNAIKINITGATVAAPAQNGCPVPVQPQPQPVPQAEAPKVNYLA